MRWLSHVLLHGFTISGIYWEPRKVPRFSFYRARECLEDFVFVGSQIYSWKGKQRIRSGRDIAWTDAARSKPKFRGQLVSQVHRLAFRRYGALCIFEQVYPPAPLNLAERYTSRRLVRYSLQAIKLLEMDFSSEWFYSHSIYFIS